MRIFASVKQILCVSLLWVSSSFGMLLPIDCGHYLGKGALEHNSQGDSLLVLGKGSSSPLELVLLGGDLNERRSYEGTEAVVDFYVPRRISTNEKPYVFVKGFTTTAQVFPPEGLIRTRKDKCRLKKYAPK